MPTKPTIIIFGAAVGPDGQPSTTLRRRVAAAILCGGMEARYMPTGGVVRHGPAEATLMASLLRDAGIATDLIELEDSATDTLSSVLACARLLGDRADIRVCSSAYHLPRCLMLLRMAGIAARACPPPHYRPEPYWILRECAALPWDAWLMWRHLRRHSLRCRS